MEAYALAILALAMSMDAFAASVARGAGMHRPCASKIFKTALVFGIVETITPIIGWAAGTVAHQFMSEWDHWIAFILLSILGCKMIYSGFSSPGHTETDASEKNGTLLLLITAIATSIDSMVVGVSLAFIDVNILVTALLIGAATTLMSAAGIALGRFFSNAIGKRAEILGGTILLLIGISMLAEHMNWF